LSPKRWRQRAIQARSSNLESAVALNAAGEKFGVNLPWAFWNMFGQQAVFLPRK
jgi:hypothetical protein